jgi:hypothetical protein
MSLDNHYSLCNKFQTKAPSSTKTDFDLDPVDDGFKGYVQIDHHISRGRLMQGLRLQIWLHVIQEQFYIVSLEAPVLDRIGIQAVVWIRIRICVYFQWGPWIRIQEGKNYPQKLNEVDKFLIFWMMDVLFWGLKASPVAWTSFM